jgi:hypothetical protein
MREALADLALPPAPHGFTVAEFRCQGALPHPGTRIPATASAPRLQPAQAAGAPRRQTRRTRRDIPAPLAASTVAARLTLRDQAIAPILAAVCSPCMGRKPAHGTRVDHDYQRLCIDI